jgi:Ni,Fe-hydrogenase I cytochrome b subunit
MENALRQNFFRAGHAHAGVIVILSLLAQIFVDAAVLPESIKWMIRIGVPASAILISAGFFFSMLSAAAQTPGRAVYLIYMGALILAVSVITSGVGLLKS